MDEQEQCKCGRAGYISRYAPIIDLAEDRWEVEHWNTSVFRGDGAATLICKACKEVYALDFDLSLCSFTKAEKVA